MLLCCIYHYVRLQNRSLCMSQLYVADAIQCVLLVQMPEAEWNDEHTRIVCELFEEQVRAGNRPNTHLNNIGYRQVAAKFQQRTELLYTKLQLKNKWDKFKNDYITWRKLLVVGKGLPWDTAKGTFVADEEWWKKINKVCCA